MIWREANAYWIGFQDYSPCKAIEKLRVVQICKNQYLRFSGESNSPLQILKEIFATPVVESYQPHTSSWYKSVAFARTPGCQEPRCFPVS